MSEESSDDEDDTSFTTELTLRVKLITEEATRKETFTLTFEVFPIDTDLELIEVIELLDSMSIPEQEG